MRKLLIRFNYLVIIILSLSLNLLTNGQTKNKPKIDLISEKAVPVILIHGIGGSDLRQKPSRGVFSDGGFPNDVLKFIAGEPQHLEFGEDGKPRPDVEESGNIYAAGFYDVPGPNITDLSKFLQRQGYQLNRTLFEFAYDFRYSTADTAVELSALIARVKRETGAAQVDLVGHSMGGLVAKTYLADSANAANVRTLIFVGTPHLGAPKALKALRYGDNLDVALIDGCKLKRAVHNMPSMFNLLPGKKYFAVSGGGYFDDDDDLDGDGVRGLLDNERMNFNLENGKETVCRLRPNTDVAPFDKLSASLLKQYTIDFHDKLDDWIKPANVRVYNLVGYGVKTIKSLRESGGKMTAEYTAEGDGTVPLWSAESVEKDAVYYIDLSKLEANHSTMIGSKQIGEQIFELLNKGEGIYIDKINSTRPKIVELKIKKRQEKRGIK